MIIFSLFLYVAFLLLLYKATPRRGDQSIFGFRNLFFLVAAAELPFLLTVAITPEVLHPRIYAKIDDLQSLFIQFLLLKALFLAAFTVTAFHLGRRHHAPVAMRSAALAPKKLAPLNLQLSIIMLFLTLATFDLMLEDLGGLEVLLLNWDIKTEVLRGTALYRTTNLVFGMLAVGFYISYIAAKGRVLMTDRVILGLILLTTMAILVSVGERKNPVLSILFLIIFWHIKVRQINILRPRFVALFLALGLFAAIFPELRRPGGTELFFSQPLTMLLASASHWGQLFARMSDVETSLFVYHYFDDPEKYWYGATIGDLFTGFVPSSLMPDKPPIDEGVYIYALGFGYQIEPPVPFRALIPVGWPLSRVTGPFVHFGVIGVFLGGLATGAIVRRIATNAFSVETPGSFFIYVWVIFTGFGLTNAFIFNLAVMAAILLPVEVYYRMRINMRPRARKTRLVRSMVR